ncbi:MAG: hypothetical protein ACK5TK_16455 [Betaproteobacteria bacterium]
MNRKSFLAATALALGLGAASIAMPASADPGDMSFEQIFKMADKNNDKMITRAEFLEAMGKAYDMKMEKMKKGKDAGKMMKGDAMTLDGFRSFINDIHHGA